VKAGTGGEPIATDGGDASMGATGNQGGTDPTAGAAGVPGEKDEPACPSGFVPWVVSTFSFPDGPVLGTADSPSLPWAGAGPLTIAGGRVGGSGIARVSQGRSFDLGVVRLRFRARFTDSRQIAAAAMNAGADGSGGLRVIVDSAGEIELFDGEQSLGKATLGPLETGTDWFVEATIAAEKASVTLSRTNYASARQAVLVETVEVVELAPQAAGSKLAIELKSQGGLSPAIDEVSLERCGEEPPDYEPLLIDTFERADSATIGKAELPTSATWIASGANASLVDGAVSLSNLASAKIQVAGIPTDGLRIRTTLSMVGGYLWADVNYNVGVTPTGVNSTEQGFWIWGDDSTGVYTGIFEGENMTVKHAGVTFTNGTEYFAELNRDGDIAVLTVRTGSFTGPIITVSGGTGLAPQDNLGNYVRLGNETGGETMRTRFKDIRIDKYASP
jgi:hypothetical protein